MRAINPDMRWRMIDREHQGLFDDANEFLAAVLSGCPAGVDREFFLTLVELQN